MMCISGLAMLSQRVKFCDTGFNGFCAKMEYLFKKLGYRVPCLLGCRVRVDFVWSL